MRLIIAIMGVLLTLSPSFAHDFVIGDLTLKHPMIKEAPPRAPVVGGYVTIVNTGAADDTLVGIESDAAAKVELHQSTVTDGIARMEPMKNGFLVPAGATVSLGENGTHAMFIDPVDRLVEGNEVSATLVFERAGRVEVVFNVEKMPAGEQMNGH
ncbi:hypothetical protein VW29_09725 [Devosia limi DSM 17137]|uniref:Copper chaperone PCu(A)C n=1 Tax=Devosia limi DSM 17137 TaxID=1121477 RepID=A0A0F5LQU0_9HYPH|nr:copper chaperone PCu(A)C [Devosia limi]KKB84666.1 hypothetical protein VW29_09725 [Devosia limi DSM 17137]SHF55050.1 hypothetical protein SAMN02745223_02951 [Devosia limi DSM 17137]